MRALPLLCAGVVSLACQDEHPTSWSHPDDFHGRGAIASYRAQATRDATHGRQLLFRERFRAGTTVRAGSCVPDGGGLQMASHQGPTHLRLFRESAGVAVEVRSATGQCPGGGAYLSYHVGQSSWLQLWGGCVGDAACSATVEWMAELDGNGELADVPAAFAALGGSWPTRLGIAKNGLTGTGTSNSKHLQGIVRLPFADGGEYDGSGWLAISESGRGRVYFGEIGQSGWGPFADLFQNTSSSGPYHPGGDRLTTYVALGMHHVGGLQSAGRFLFAPTESGARSRIYAIDAGSPYVPLLMSGGYPIERSDGPAGAVAVARHGGGYWMAVAETDADRVDFYRKAPPAHGWSNLRDNERQPFEWVTEWTPGPGRQVDTTRGGDGSWGRYQNLNLIAESSGRLYLLGTEGGARADLFEVHLDDGVRLEKVDSQIFDCGAVWCDFRGAAGSFLDPDHNRLLVYSTRRYFNLDPSRPSARCAPDVCPTWLGLTQFSAGDPQGGGPEDVVPPPPR